MPNYYGWTRETWFLEDNDSRGIVMPNPLNVVRVVAILLIFLLHAFAIDGYFTMNPTDNFLLYSPAWAGVWILFVLSGYLAAKSFEKGRYSFTPKSVLEYYLKRIVHVYIPAVCFALFIYCVLCNPSFFNDNTEIIKQILTLRYNGQPDNGLGALWFICTIMWLYLCTPFFSKILELIGRIKHSSLILSALFIVIMVAGLLIRLKKMEMDLSWGDWQYVYTRPYYNLDLFCSGMIIAYLLPKIKPLLSSNIVRILKIVSAAMLVALIVYNCKVYSEFDYNIYKYKLPTAYCAVVSLFIVAFEVRERPYVKDRAVRDVIRHPLTVIDKLADVSFEFFLFHSTVISLTWMHIVNEMNLGSHIKVVLVTGVLSLILAILYHRAFRGLLPVENLFRCSHENKE